jgi:hypothetical protein
MDDQEALAAVNHDIPPEKLQSLVRQGNTTSFIFSIKNRVGGLARALKVFQVDFNHKLTLLVKNLVVLLRGAGKMEDENSVRKNIEVKE